MSQTRLLCEKCGAPQCYCTCPRVDPDERFAIRYVSRTTGLPMYVVEVGEPYEEWNRNVRASNKLESARRYTQTAASEALEMVREVHPHAEIFTLP